MVTLHLNPDPADAAEPPRALLGRAEELRLLAELWQAPAGEITLTGVVGVGKSALARACADAAESAVGLIQLDRVTDERELWARLPDVASWDALQARIETLGLARLVLDNADVPTIADALRRELRARLPELTLLLTTARPPSSPHARTLQLLPLAAPEPAAASDLGRGLDEWPGLQLWLALTPELGPERDLELGSRIVQELDGLPLALTLAAPRARLLGERKLLDSLERRFELLRRRPGVSLRHEGLGAAFDDLWAGLGADERDAVTGLAIFPMGFTLDSGAALLGRPELDFWDLLEQLVRRGLVTGDATQLGPRRFHVLRCLRAHVLRDGARARAADAHRRDHALHFCRAASGAASFAALQSERANLEQGVAWLEALEERAPEEDSALLMGLLGLARLRWARGPHGQLAERLDRALERAPGLDPALRVEARVAQAADLRRGGELARAAELLERVRDSADGTLLEAVTGELAAVTAARGATSEAEAALATAMEDSSCSPREQTKLRIRLADLLHRHSTHRRARELLEQAIADAEAQGEGELEVSARLNLANVCVSEMAFGEAQEQLARAQARAQAMGHEYFEAYGLLARALLEQVAGRDGRELAEQAARALTRLGHERDAGVAESQLSLMALEAGDPGDALGHARASLRLLSGHAIPFRELTRARYAAALAEADRLSDAEEEWESCWPQLVTDAGGKCAVAAQVHAGHLHLARHRACLDRGREAPGEAHRARAQEALRAPSREQELSTEVRLAQRALEASLARARPAQAICVVRADGRVFTPAGQPPVDISRRGALRRILKRLAQALREAPGVGVDPDAIFEAGWPGQSIHPEQAGARVYNAIFELRRLGLGELLLRHDDGYLLCPDGVRLEAPG